MSNKLKIAVWSLVWITVATVAQAQPAAWTTYDTTGYFTREVISRKGYTLTFVNLDTAFDQNVAERLIRTFFKVYPKEAKVFNPSSASEVTFIIDPEYKGVAATSRATVRFNPDWFRKHPEDIDVVTHEVMHIVQNYHSGHIPGWLTEGIADYVRYAYGINNKAAGWTLPDHNARQSYKNAYRITARFLVWVTARINKSVVKKLDAALRNGTYNKKIWKKLTGKNIAELWQSYAEDPAVRLTYR